MPTSQNGAARERRLTSAGDLREIALAEASRFEDEFTQERLNALIRSHGVAPDSADRP